MDQDVQQPALDGLTVRPARRRKRTAKAEPLHTPAPDLPIAQVVLDVQATHLGGTFDYLVDARQDKRAQPGVPVRVHFGSQRVTGVIWDRRPSSQVPVSALRYLEQILSPHVVVSDSMREDIASIASAYGGTEANVLRMAVPPRVAKVDREQGLVAGQPRLASDLDWVAALDASVRRAEEGLAVAYPDLTRLGEALEGTGFSSWVVGLLPGPGQRWSMTAWVLARALLDGRSAICVLPDMRQVARLSAALQALGMRPFSPDTAAGTGQAAPGWTGDFAILGSSMPPTDRYRAYLAVACGQVRCVIGLRAAMYAPVEGPALFALMDDASYQYADGKMPYANARGVLRLRARAHGGVFMALGQSRSVRSQWECGPDALEVGSGVTGPAGELVPARAGLADRMPWVRWLNRDELMRLADATVGARVPHTAVAVLTKALNSGPVLLSIPQDGVGETMSCAFCHRQARCRRCTGPLQVTGGNAAPRCAWCGAPAVDWVCPGCGKTRMRAIRVGAAGTARELQLLFRNVPIVISSASQPRGIVETIEDRPALVIATPGSEPRVRPGADGNESAGYRAVAILDAWTSLYSQGVDASLDTLTAWMRVAGLCLPRSDGGQVLILGETFPLLAQSLMTWNPSLLARAELDDRRQMGFPPACAAATVWGRRDAVMQVLQEAGALDGDYALLETAEGEVPATLGPVPIAPPKTLSNRILVQTADRVRALVRVPPVRRDEMALRLKASQAKYVAGRGRGELHFHVDPKDLT